MSRQNLPYRETSDCFLIYDGKLVGRLGHNPKTNTDYLNLPGGGIDEGETPIQGAKRECLEEVGAKIKNMKRICTVYWDWFPEWATTPKSQERYKKFRGEKIHLMLGEVEEFVTPTSTEGDAWVGKKFMTLAAAIKLSESNKDHPNMYAYRVAQITVLNMIKLLQN